MAVNGLGALPSAWPSYGAQAAQELKRVFRVAGSRVSGIGKIFVEHKTLMGAGAMLFRSFCRLAVLLITAVAAVDVQAQMRPCVEGVCLGDALSAVNGFSFEVVESFGQPLSPRKKRTIDAVYPSYPKELAAPLLQGRFDNRILEMLSNVDRACMPRQLVGKTKEQAGVQTQFTLRLDLSGHWRVVGISQVFPPAGRQELRQLMARLDAQYKDFAEGVPSRVATYMFVPLPASPYFVLTLPLPDWQEMDEFARRCS